MLLHFTNFFLCDGNKDNILGLKQLIKRQKLLANAISSELTLPGEPLIYSIKYPAGQRSYSVQFFRNEKWKSLLKSWFPSYYNTKVPVVVIVQFFVTPPEKARVSKAELKKETVPAVFSYELCDYLLSFIEMLHHVLINSYRQIVKFDIQKFYSDNPRTVFKFMKWDQYVNLSNVQNTNSGHTQSEGLSPRGQIRTLQSKRKGDGADKKLRSKEHGSQQNAQAEGASTGNCSLPNSSSSDPVSTKKKSARSSPTYKET